MATRLRPYHQWRCVDVGVRRLYVDLPTGTGKSTIAAAFAVQRLVHRQDLALQMAETLRQEGLEVGLLMQGSGTCAVLRCQPLALLSPEL